MDARSERSLEGVNEKLVKVVKKAVDLSEISFIVTEGLRTKERQAILVKQGASRTMNSMHIVGRAVDLAPVVNGEVRWDWPLFYKLADAMKKAATEVGVTVEWGGDWTSFKDGPHFQLGSKE